MNKQQRLIVLVASVLGLVIGPYPMYANAEPSRLLLELGQAPTTGEEPVANMFPQDPGVLWLELGDRSLVNVDEWQPGDSIPGTYGIPDDPAVLWLELGNKKRVDGPGATIPTDPAVLLLELGDASTADTQPSIPMEPETLLLELGDAATADGAAPLPTDPAVLLLELGDASARAETIPFPEDPATLFLELGRMESGAWIVFRKGGNCQGEFWINSVAYHCDTVCRELPVVFQEDQIVTLYYQVPNDCEFSGYTDRSGRLFTSSELSVQAYAGDVITIMFQKP